MMPGYRWKEGQEAGWTAQAALCTASQEAEANTLQVYSPQIAGEGPGNRRMPSEGWVPWEDAYLSVKPGNR